MKSEVEQLQDVFDRIKKAGGDIKYVIHALSLIWKEEHLYIHGKKHPVEDKNSPEILTDTTLSEIRKRHKDKFVDISDESIPEFIRKKMRELEAGLFWATFNLPDTLRKRPKNITINAASPEINEAISNLLIANPDIDGRYTITYEREISYNNEMYILKTSATQSLINFTKRCRGRRGRKGQPKSNLSMYLLYRYFKRLGLRDIYSSIALPVNQFTHLFFRKGVGAPLSPDNIRKRVQWVKKQTELLNLASEWEKRWKKEI